ncbi:hypothetical protein GA0116948_107198 [Chitinophaga costaii]|uniref:Uncharacterized protein n=1 Tax=Chitinophaga costaii TaxID=1335309 RepID=A0A1C4EA39_9BACT|nr:hypothetical protein [Chitinophaga costaii]PUZ24222.1 hypothetical protein DCM91_12350 [Chitinophaga costaii]SCC40415.1 hypothetical protein GA0116948_107198 [Chitinophaga costaii]
MNRFFSVLFWVFIFYILLIIVSNLVGLVTFGRGLGDIYFLIWIIVSVILSICLKFFVNKFDAFVVVVGMLLSIFITLEISIWRGIEYKWNGHIFLY